MLIATTSLADWLTVGATALAAVAAVAAACAAFISDRTNRRLEATRRQLDYAMWAMRITPQLHAELGSPNDGLDADRRAAVIELLELGAAHWRDEQQELLGSDWAHMRTILLSGCRGPRLLRPGLH